MTDEIAKASGRVGMFESEGLRFRIVLRVLGHRYWSWIPLLAVFTVLVLTGAKWLNDYLDDDDWLTNLALDWLPVFFIGAAFVFLVQRLNRQLRSAWYKRGVPREL